MHSHQQRGLKTWPLKLLRDKETCYMTQRSLSIARSRRRPTYSPYPVNPKRSIPRQQSTKLPNLRSAPIATRLKRLRQRVSVQSFSQSVNYINKQISVHALLTLGISQLAVWWWCHSSRITGSVQKTYPWIFDVLYRYAIVKWWH